VLSEENGFGRSGPTRCAEATVRRFGRCDVDVTDARSAVANNLATNLPLIAWTANAITSEGIARGIRSTADRWFDG
jgi:hypothetical protein